MIWLEVAVAAPVSQFYSYELPGDLAAGLHDMPSGLVGRRVLVPFGKRRTTGYVCGVSEGDPPAFALKAVAELLDDGPLFPAELVPLFTWVADYYHYPVGEVIKTALPAGLIVSCRRQVQLAEGADRRRLDGHPAVQTRPGWLERLCTDGSLTLAESKKVLASRRDRKRVDDLVAAGLLRIDTSLSSDRVGQKLETCYRLGAGLVSALAAAGDGAGDSDGVRAVGSSLSGRPVGKAEARTILEIAELAAACHTGAVPRRELLARYPYSGAVLASLIEANLVESLSRRIYRTPLGDLLPRYERPERSTEEQRCVGREIGRALERREYRSFLLHGITGSGKTEVYLTAAEQALAAGRTVLVLVPEIALATQIEAHFVSRFGDRVALLHSGLTAGERYDEWSRVLSGAARVVIGARSAVFAPLRNLGLVIVDEEHDASYKQEDNLRYNGRDVAVVRAQQQQAVAVLGSATPAITSYLHGQQGKFTPLTMRSRVGGRQLPTVSVIDLKDKKRDGDGSLFHDTLRLALSETLAHGKQSIILLNRRGFSASVVCRDCGAMVECRHCKVTLNLHKGRKRLICHYCGYSVPENVICAVCASGNLSPVGFGTERVEEEVRALLPEARVARLDSDVSADRRAFLSILQAVRKKEVDILVGTQMIAKGLHFPDVTLVGIVWADAGLAFPDYRAAEKTYQLLAQVTGRAGRGDTPGRVIIQTMQPEHYAISLAAGHRYEDLAAREIGIRRQAGFPPFMRLVSLRVEDDSEQRVRSRAQEIGEEARAWCRRSGQDGVVTILGPAPAPLEKLRDRYRWQILLKASRLGVLHDLVDHIDATFRGRGGGRLIIDVDPENML